MRQVSRMMLNIRGLMFNDPLGSQGLSFSISVFRNQDHVEHGSQGADTVQYFMDHV